MSPFTFEKEKYIQIFKSEGVNAALTRLHQDVREWEYTAFEGEQGYLPEMWQALELVRQFSRELWEMGAN